MELTDTQVQTVRTWVEDEGCGLAEVQKRMGAELGVTMTYMDVRFLLIDLGLDLKEAAPSRPAGATDLSGGPPSPSDDLLGGGGATQGVSVEVDRLVKPGSIVSGKVTFSDGTAADWSLDQSGRLALSAPEPGYRPSDEDLQAFQEELRAALEKKGF